MTNPADINTTTLVAFLKLIDFLSDPAAFRARVEEMLNAAMHATAETEKAAAASAQIDAKQAAADTRIKADREANESQLAADRQDFERTRAASDARLKDREAALTENQKSVAAAEKSVAAEQERIKILRADLTERIAAINRAARPL
jgi:hypothetical protein